MKNKLLATRLFLVCLMLIAAVSLTFVSCETVTETPQTSSTGSSAGSTDGGTSSLGSDPSSALDSSRTVGEGQTSFAFTATMLDGSVKVYTVRTDKATVGEALQETGLISGTAGAYGLYVDTVCGEYHLYEKDGKYWAFYINGEYAMGGVDTTAIDPSAAYALKAE